MVIGIKINKMEVVWQKYITQLEKKAEIIIISDESNQISINELQRINILITTKIQIEMLKKMDVLEAVFLYKTGTDKLPLQELYDRGISIFPSHANSKNIAEHAIALALAITHRIPEFHNDLANGVWYGDGENYYWDALRNMKIGILGFGNIGKEIANMVKGFSDKIFTIEHKHSIVNSEVTVLSSLDELLKTVDILFVSVPKNEDTDNMMSEKELRYLEGKYLVNVGRSEVFDEKILFEFLEKRVLKGFASDVWYREADKKNRLNRQFPSKYAFEKLNNVILSPHCSTHEVNGHDAYIQDAVQKCIKYIEEAQCLQ